MWQWLLPSARLQPITPVGRSSRARPVCHAFKRGMQQQQQADAAASSSSTATTGEAAVIFVAVPIEQAPAAQQETKGGSGIAWVLVAAAVAAGLAFKKLKSGDPSRDYMRNINSLQTDDLDPEIIAAARARRSRERANHRLDLNDIELPENHPWATRKPVTAEQEAAIQARLQVRPRRTGPGDGRTGTRTG